MVGDGGRGEDPPERSVSTSTPVKLIEFIATFDLLMAGVAGRRLMHNCKASFQVIPWLQKLRCLSAL